MSERSSIYTDYGQLDAVRQVVDRLVPGYFIQELDPLNALETGQGNCFTNAMIAGAVLAQESGVEASVAWSSKLHAIPEESASMVKPSGAEFGKATELKIGHIELLVPRGTDQFDVLSLGYGMHVVDGAAYTKEDKGGEIMNYNFMDINPRIETAQPDRADEALVEIVEDGVIVATEFGQSEAIQLNVMDWQEGGTEYLAALDIPEIDYERLARKVSCFACALRDGRKTTLCD